MASVHAIYKKVYRIIETNLLLHQGLEQHITYSDIDPRPHNCEYSTSQTSKDTAQRSGNDEVHGILAELTVITIFNYAVHDIASEMRDQNL